MAEIIDILSDSDGSVVEEPFDDEGSNEPAFIWYDNDDSRPGIDYDKNNSPVVDQLKILDAEDSGDDSDATIVYNKDDEELAVDPDHCPRLHSFQFNGRSRSPVDLSGAPLQEYSPPSFIKKCSQRLNKSKSSSEVTNYLTSLDFERESEPYASNFCSQNSIADKSEDIERGTKSPLPTCSIGSEGYSSLGCSEYSNSISKSDSGACTQFTKGCEPYVSTSLQNSQVSKAKEVLKLARERKQKEKEMLKEKKAIEMAEKKRLREKKKSEALRERAFRVAISSKQKSMKPEESIKLTNVLIDTQIINAAYGSQICALLQQNNIKYSVQSLNFPETIIWTKTIKESVINDDGEVLLFDKLQEEDFVISIIPWNRVVNLIVDSELESHITRLKTGSNKTKITLLLFGLEKYFNHQKKKVNRAVAEAVAGSQPSKRKKSENEFERAAVMTMDELEMVMTDIQLTSSVNQRWVETAEEVATLILQFTKAISQIESKQEKYNKEMESLSWFAKGDNKSCVKVDKNGLGLLSLWQQQILQFNNVCLEVAQAIVGQYGSPQALMEAYRLCPTSREAELLLQDIPVRREAGILSSTRRVGPELSKKIYRFFTSRDPNQEL